VDLRNNRFEYREVHVAADSFPSTQGQSSHAHSQSAASVTREDIEQAKRQSIQMAPPDRIREDVSESASASVSTAMHHMIDVLVDSEVSDDPPPALHLTPLSPTQSFPMTPTMANVQAGSAQWPVQQQRHTFTAQDLVNSMLCSQGSSDPVATLDVEREDTMRPPVSSACDALFVPLSNAIKSPQTRPTTAHRVQPETSTPVPFSSDLAFQQDILQRQQNLQFHSTPIHSPLASSRWSCQASPGTQFPPLPSSPWRGSPSTSTPTIAYRDGDEVPRKAPQPAMFGAIGQTPPSAQAG
jgi:hypothetical protein